MILKQDIYKAWIYIICLYLEKQSINLYICLYQIVSIYCKQLVSLRIELNATELGATLTNLHLFK